MTAGRAGDWTARHLATGLARTYSWRHATMACALCWKTPAGTTASPPPWRGPGPARAGCSSRRFVFTARLRVGWSGGPRSRGRADRNPKELYAAARAGIDIVGDRNDEAIRRATSGAMRTVAAWGVHGRLLDRATVVVDLLQEPLCLGLTRHGEPRHPLYVPTVTEPIAFGPLQ
jgi:hypothetical protein